MSDPGKVEDGRWHKIGRWAVWAALFPVGLIAMAVAAVWALAKG